jgi:hypothetical protein
MAYASQEYIKIPYIREWDSLVVGPEHMPYISIRRSNLIFIGLIKLCNCRIDARRWALKKRIGDV